MAILYLASRMMVFIPAFLTPFTVLWFPESLCLIFSNPSFIGRMSNLKNRYRLETEHFFDDKSSHIPSETTYHDCKSQT